MLRKSCAIIPNDWAYSRSIRHKFSRSGQVFPTRENPPTKPVGYENNLRVTTRQHNGGSGVSAFGIVAPSKGVSELGVEAGKGLDIARLSPASSAARLSGVRVQERPDAIFQLPSASVSSSAGGTLPGRASLPDRALSFQLAPGGKVPGASRTAAAVGAERRPSTTFHGTDA